MKNRKIILYMVVPIASALLVGSVLLPKMAKVPTGYTAKVLCSEIFLAGREAAEIISQDFNNISTTFHWVNLQVNEESNSVQSTLLGMGKSIATYREGIGCSLQGKHGLTDLGFRPTTIGSQFSYTSNIDADIQNAVLRLFDDAQLSNPVNTRGVVVIQRGKVVAEHYAQGFDKNTRQQSWSIAKGFMQALIGIAIKKKYIALDDNELMPEWQGADSRSQITIGQLLHMSSGLEFDEAYANPMSHVDQMLFNQDDMGDYAAGQKLIATPGTVSAYSSGTSNILSNILRRRLGEHGVNYHAFPYEELFDKLSMSSAIFEVDASGHFIGSSYIYATLRDFAKFGQLYLQNGVWDEEQLLPSEWVEYTRQEAPQSDGRYGSHWSLNNDQKVLPGLPKDVLHLGGNDGQMIVVIPSKYAVIVRTGITRYPATTEDDVYPLIRGIYENLN